MYILLISRGIPTLKDPQWGCFEKDQADALVALGHKVVVISSDARIRLHYRKIGITKAVMNGVEYYNSYMGLGVLLRLAKHAWFSLYRKISAMQMSRAWKSAIQEHGMPDVLYSHYLPNSLAAYSIKCKYGIPLVAIEHWSEVGRPVLRKNVRKMGDIVYPGADAVIAVSKNLQENIRREFGVRSIVVNNLVGEAFVYHEPVRHEGFNFVSVGSLIYGKGHDVLIKALARVRSGVQVHLNIIGEGRYRKKLEGLIKKHGLEERIHLCGKMQKTQIIEIMRSSDAFVFGSRYENFSVALLEALSQGLPSIVTDCGGARDCIHDKNGMIVDIDSVEQMADAMQTMIGNFDKYDRKYIADDYQRKFSSESIARQITAVLEDVLKQKRCRCK